MPEIATLLPADDPRLAVLRAGPTGADARVVLSWVKRAQRATDNLAANRAIELAFPRATCRAYRFMAEG